eukprot:GHUV01012467.1.p1 GENE.GHUV01012467.1~~GHUV01012467.1.p1  ORF type:complete len:302 (+),score=67.68 GHUV01012467.1:102-1007(+)
MRSHNAEVHHVDIEDAQSLEQRHLLDDSVWDSHVSTAADFVTSSIAKWRSNLSTAKVACEGAAARTRLTLLVCLLLLSATVAQYLNAQQLQLLVESAQHARLGSIVVFTLLFGIAVVLLLPGMLLSIATGAAYGFYIGLGIAWTGTVLGQVGAFLLGRYLLRDIVFSFMVKRIQGFATIDKKLSGHDSGGNYWTPYTFVLLLRLSPVLPYNLMNYVLGVTSIDLLPYALSSAVATAPYVTLFVFLGSTATDLHALLTHGTGGPSPEWLIVLACIGIMSVIGLFLILRNVCQTSDTDEVDVS